MFFFIARRRILFTFLTSLLISSHTFANDLPFALGYAAKYPADFTHFAYANPEAPREGSLTLSAFGTFDRLNPFILRGIGAAGLELLTDTLLVKSLDEPFSMYGLLAKSATLAADRLSVTFVLDENARFSDGSPVTAADVKFSFDTLMSAEAHPQYQIYWQDIDQAEVIDELTIRFTFKKKNAELHMIIGELPVFSANWLKGRKLNEVVNEPPLASGPYLLSDHTPGRVVRYTRRADYWAKDKNVRRGFFNFQEVRYRYYRDLTITFEAFKAGEFDFFHENSSLRWATAYEGGRFADGTLQKESLPHRNNQGMQGFVFNLRRPIFQDIRVRQALTLLYDFEWANQNLFYGQYQRAQSFFSNSELAATGLPSAAESALLKPFEQELKKLPADIFSEVWQAPINGNAQAVRTHQQQAFDLLRAAGWQMDRQKRLLVKDGQEFRIFLPLVDKAFERIVGPFAENLRRLGIVLDYRVIDVSLYVQRMEEFDFDMIVATIPQSESPGNEQRNYFHSQSAQVKGSDNLAGIDNPVVDALIDGLIQAESREDLIAHTRALDRVLLHHYYVLPNWFIDYHRVAYRRDLAHPTPLPLYYQPLSNVVQLWWRKE
jgi:microcin C transport system substrate-binding protein